MILKRAVDILISTLGLLLSSPFLIMIAIIIKLESKGPILYHCTRVGRYRKNFGMLKFRTMLHNADNIDCKLCANSDVRVTSFGKFLRRTKLNELPQLINVLKGEMSLVGPRPEDPKFVCGRTEKWNIVLSVKPGIFGPNQVLHRNEEDVLEICSHPEDFYVNELLPKKLEIDVNYVLNMSPAWDIKLLLQGAYETIFGSGKIFQALKNYELYENCLQDVCLSILAYLSVYYFRFETIHSTDVIPNIVILILINPIVFGFSGIYKRANRFFSSSDLLLIVKISIVSGTLFFAGNKFFLVSQAHSRTVFLFYPLILLSLMSCMRLLRRVFMEKNEKLSDEMSLESNVLIYGAGRLGVDTAKSLQFEPGVKLVGFIDDDPNKRNLTIFGYRVLGAGKDLPFLKSLYGIEKIFLAFRSPSTEQLIAVRQYCNDAAVPHILIRNHLSSSTGSTPVLDSFRKLRSSDLLGMPEVPLNVAQLRGVFEGSAVALDGAGDHIGESFCREILRLGISSLVLIETCPQKLHRVSCIANSIKQDSTRIYPYLIPGGFYDFYATTLSKHNLDLLIFNRPSRLVTNASKDNMASLLIHFLDTVRKIEALKQLPCRRVSFLSQFLKDYLSDQEKALHLLIEYYVKNTFHDPSALPEMLGVMRLANILEADCEIFRYSAQLMQKRNSEQRIRFTSARYAARITLNSIPLVQEGNIFVECVSQPYNLSTFIEYYYGLISKDIAKTISVKARKLISADLNYDDQELLSRCTKTTVCDLLVLDNHEVPDVQGLKFFLEGNERYLNSADRILMGEFISHLNNRLQKVSKMDENVRYRLDAA